MVYWNAIVATDKVVHFCFLVNGYYSFIFSALEAMWTGDFNDCCKHTTVWCVCMWHLFNVSVPPRARCTAAARPEISSRQAVTCEAVGFMGRMVDSSKSLWRLHSTSCPARNRSFRHRGRIRALRGCACDISAD